MDGEKNQHRQQEIANTDCKSCLKVKGEVVPENRAEIESSIRKSLNNVVAPDSVEVSEQMASCFRRIFVSQIGVGDDIIRKIIDSR